MVLAAAAIVVAIGAAVWQGSEQKAAQTKINRRQQQAQRDAASQAAAQQRRSAMEQRLALRKTPDVQSLLGRERLKALQGPSATLLTGGSGFARSGLKLGSSSLLGG